MAGKLATLFSFIFVTTVAAMAVPPKRQTTLKLVGQELNDRTPATWFNPSGVGACGVSENGGEHIAAVSPAFRNLCGALLAVTGNGKCTVAVITDVCPGCGEFNLDLSPAAFQDLAPLSTGKVEIVWTIL
ncbi:hypothetical protein BD410DRAFT_832470 [Rickenella mellea]|uniref:RlpA-like protein double-psi beta-barrel domain-containing protein n=1 Tax=Rickenella mellea TaxID=50990 RepID=A0A4Y7PMP6_9AGAM|nr:hypothetical protein BD410DRAFT_832470 [Rickenella mellea]